MAKVREFTLTKGGNYQLVRVCEKRANGLSKPKKITNVLFQYLPFDDGNTQKLNVSNMLGMTLPQFELKSGQVYDGYDGPRIIYEVGCDTVIYLNGRRQETGRFEFYIQHMDNFVYDVTNRSIAAKVVEATKPIKTIVQYEMYFILGFVSTASLPALVLVVGTDITISSLMAKRKALAAKNLGQDLLREHKAMKEYAPTLHRKLEECFFSQAKVEWADFGTQLPKTIITDEKTQGQLAGVLTGKAVLSPKAFTVWTAVFTILTTAAIKSVTKTPEAYGKVIESKYKPIVEELQQVDWNNTEAASRASIQLKELMEESGISVSTQEALLILKEVSSNSDKLKNSLIKVDQSFREFVNVIHE